MSLFTKSLAAVSLVVCCGAFAAAARPDEKPKFEVRKAEVKPTDGLTSATIAGTTEKIYLHKDAALTSKDVAKAEASIDAAGNPTVVVILTEDGAKKFAKLTEAHKDKPLAILFEGKVVSAPTVRDVIADGKAVISGKFTREEAERVAKGISAK
jgi:preprotein translocase subunit SecD